LDVTAFYGVLAGLSFTLLGLWWVACQSRMAWLFDRVGRGMAYVVSLHFALPGAMSLLSLVAPDVPFLWRVTFAVSGIFGLMGTALMIATVRRRATDPGLVLLLQWIGAPLYAIVATVAISPELVAGLGIGLAPLQVEGITLVLLVLLGTQSAWLVTFAEPERPD
jgi:uncharacterized membrane protein